MILPLKIMTLPLKIMIFVTGDQTRPISNQRKDQIRAGARGIENDEYSFKHDELCIKNDNFRI